jgi:hypothetical protein
VRAPEDQRIRFFVYIVESPSPVDVYHGRGEGQMVAQAVRLNLIPAVVRIAISREAFEASLRVGITEAMQAYPGLVPILHISAHGNEEGIGLSSGEHITWRELRELFKPINHALGGALLVCLSCCKGYSGTRMAMYPDDPNEPYFALIGNIDSPTWADTAVAYAALYHLLGKGEYLVDAVPAMRVASGNEYFVLESSERSKQAYLAFLQTVDVEAAEERLGESVVTSEPVSVEQLEKFAK